MEFFNKDSEIIKNMSKSNSDNDNKSENPEVIDNFNESENPEVIDNFNESENPDVIDNFNESNNDEVIDNFNESKNFMNDDDLNEFNNNESNDNLNSDEKNHDENNNSFEFDSDSSNKSLNSEIVDVRIIVTDVDYIESISKAVSNFDLNNFNVVISSIIPARNISIAKTNVVNADLVLIAIEFTDKGKKLFNDYYDGLKTDSNQVEYLKIPSGNFENVSSFEDEIANSIIRIGLSKVSNLSIINLAKSKYFDLKNSFNEKIKDNEKLAKNIDDLTLKNDNLNKINEDLLDEIKTLQKDLDKIKSDFSDFKSKYVNIYSKDFLEIYSLDNLWFEAFSEKLTVDEEEFIEIATNNFRPEDILLGQGFIGAKSKEAAIDWLKITRTAFVVVNNSSSIDNININGNNSNNFNDDNSLEEVKDIFKELNDDGYSDNLDNFGGLNILNTEDNRPDFYEINEDFDNEDNKCN